MTYEKLVIENDSKVEILEDNIIERLKGLYFQNTIVINTNIDTDAEKKCVLAEELGHHYTTTGDILNQDNVDNIRQELRAREWGYRKIVPPEKIIEGIRYGTQSLYELANYLHVTEEYLSEALEHYISKHGEYYKTDRYILVFSPLSIIPYKTD